MFARGGVKTSPDFLHIGRGVINFCRFVCTNGAAVAKKPFILTGVWMNAKEFCEKQIAYWLNESRKASDNADLEAFEFAEQELANYREMLKQILKRYAA